MDRESYETETDTFQFQHTFYRDGDKSEYYDLIKPILNNVADNIELHLWITAFRLFPGMIIAWLILFYQKNINIT